MTATRKRPSLLERLRRKTRGWARKRHGDDTDPTTLSGRRIYILPSALGVAFGAMIFAMFLGAMNYGNNLALALAFLLGALGLTAMHHCHRNLAGIRIRAGASEPAFAGGRARFRVALENPAPLARHELAVANDYGIATPTRIEPDARETLELELPAERRGQLTLDHFELTTRYPFGLFRAWTYLHMPMTCIVYPRPSERSIAPPPVQTDTGGAQEHGRGDEDFAGLRGFHPGDPPSRIAWKAYARERGLQVKQYAGTAVTSHYFDWEAIDGMDVEARLSLLCRWIEDAHAAGRAYGLRMPGVDLPPNVGPAHRQRCLTALALFEAS